MRLLLIIILTTLIPTYTLAGDNFTVDGKQKDMILFHVWVSKEDAKKMPGLGLSQKDVWQKLVTVSNCRVQNDGSTWCDYAIDGTFLKRACYSDWDGGYCDGDETQD